MKTDASIAARAGGHRKRRAARQTAALGQMVLSPVESELEGDGVAAVACPILSAAAGASVWHGGRQLYGSFSEGVSVNWHDFETERPVEWSESFYPESLGLCLNLGGQGWVRNDGKTMDFGPSSCGFYLPGRGGLQAVRNAGQRHRFVALKFSAGFLREKVSAQDGALHPLVDRFIRGGTTRAEAGAVRRLTEEEDRGLAQLPHPPVPQAARELWYEGKVLELMAAFFFEQPEEAELFCDRQKRVARERVDRVMALLRGHLVEPPNLAEIGRRVGCSPYYLSRTFSAETEMTIPQYLRKLRIERAAELLRSGKYNVTEAAMEVGYSSLSHFSLAFCQTMGCCPTLYPLRATNR